MDVCQVTTAIIIAVAKSSNGLRNCDVIQKWMLSRCDYCSVGAHCSAVAYQKTMLCGQTCEALCLLITIHYLAHCLHLSPIHGSVCSSLHYLAWCLHPSTASPGAFIPPLLSLVPSSLHYLAWYLHPSTACPSAFTPPLQGPVPSSLHCVVWCLHHSTTWPSAFTSPIHGTVRSSLHCLA